MTLEANVPADANSLTLSFAVTGSGRLTFDDVKATADGLDVTGQLINPGMEEVVSGFPPRGWLLSATPRISTRSAPTGPAPSAAA